MEDENGEKIFHGKRASDSRNPNMLKRARAKPSRDVLTDYSITDDVGGAFNKSIREMEIPMRDKNYVDPTPLDTDITD